MRSFVYFSVIQKFLWSILSRKINENINLIDETLAGASMGNITGCRYKDSSSTVQPRDIYIVMLASPDYREKYKFQIESVRLYSYLHVYNLRVVDPGPVVAKYSMIMPNVSGLNNETIMMDFKLISLYCECNITVPLSDVLISFNKLRKFPCRLL